MAVRLALPRAWWFPDLPGFRAQTGATYARYELDAQPPVAGDESLHWLEVESEKAEWSIEQGDEGQQTRALTVPHLDALVPDLRLPSSLRVFASRPDLQRRIRSVTACYLDLADFAVPAAGADGKLVHVLSDQQWCRHWLVYVGADDQEAVVTSAAPIGFELPEDWPNAPPSVIPLDGENDLEVCADSFAEFLYRFWIENELWQAIVDGRPLSGALAAYAAQLARRS